MKSARTIWMRRVARSMAELISLALLGTGSSAAWAGVNQWTSIGPDGGGDILALAIAPQNPAIVYASAGRTVFKSTDGAMSWASTGSTIGVGALVVDPQNSDTLYALASNGVAKSSDGGTTWSAANSGLPDGLSGPYTRLVIDPRNSRTLYVSRLPVGNPASPNFFSILFKTTDGAMNWRPATSGLPGSPGIAELLALAIDPKDSGTLYASVARLPVSRAGDGGVFKSTDGGASWNAANSGLTTCCVTALAIDPQDSKTIYAARGLPGEAGGIFKSTNGGTNWTAIDTDLPGGAAFTLAIDPRNPATLYAVTFAGLVKSTNGGASWNPANLAGQVRTFAIDPLNAGTIYAAAAPSPWGPGGNGVLKTTNGGTIWNEANSGIKLVPIWNLAIDSQHSGTWYGTNGGKIFKTTDGGAHWIAGTQAARKAFIDPQDPATVFAFVNGALSNLAKSTDGGMTWLQLNLPSNDFVTDLAIDPRNSSTVYVGTAKGVFKSSDGGASWTLANAGLEQDGVTALAISGQDPTVIYAGTSIGMDCDDCGVFGDGIFKSADAGATWTAVNSGLPGGSVPHRRYVFPVAIDPGNPATLYIGVASSEGRGLFRSVDAGASWKGLGSGLPGGVYIASLAIDPRNSSTVYLGTDKSVFRSADGGEKWSAVNSGLGELYIRSLTIDPQDSNTVYAGTDGGLFTITFAP